MESVFETFTRGRSPVCVWGNSNNTPEVCWTHSNSLSILFWDKFDIITWISSFKCRRMIIVRINWLLVSIDYLYYVQSNYVPVTYQASSFLSCIVKSIRLVMWTHLSIMSCCLYWVPTHFHMGCDHSAAQVFNSFSFIWLNGMYSALLNCSFSEYNV